MSNHTTIVLSLRSASDGSAADSAIPEVDASAVIPLKKQQGFLNMLGHMMSILGSKLEPQLSVLFPISVKLGSFCAELLRQRDQVLLTVSSQAAFSEPVYYFFYVAIDTAPFCECTEDTEAAGSHSSQ